MKQFGKKDLVFAHVPINFGYPIEKVSLNGERWHEVARLQEPFLIQPSFQAAQEDNKWNAIRLAKGFGGEIWGSMHPDLREVSNVTGCNLYQTPQRYWPDATARSYFGDKRVFGLLRDPYDKVVAEFRAQASGGGRSAMEPKRRDVSEREYTPERELEEYQGFYSSCDLNSWVQAELTRVRQGDQFRGNCHLLPQSEYFEQPYGITLPVDARLLPESFDKVMSDHGYNFKLDTASIGVNWSCAKLSAWSLSEASKALIREVYAADFDLICKTFGYCDNKELTCMQQLPLMCGSSPFDNPSSSWFVQPTAA